MASGGGSGFSLIQFIKFIYKTTLANNNPHNRLYLNNNKFVKKYSTRGVEQLKSVQRGGYRQLRTESLDNFQRVGVWTRTYFSLWRNNYKNLNLAWCNINIINYRQLFCRVHSLGTFLPQVLLRKKPLPLTYLLLPFPLKIVLTPVSCEDYLCKCEYKDKECADGSPVIKCDCKSCSASPPCPPSSTLESKDQNQKCNKDDPKNSRKGRSPVNWREPDQLTHRVLIRQACQISVDSVTRVISETISAYQDYHEEYRKLLDIMMDALECSRTAQGTQLELTDCKLIMIRSRVEEMNSCILELESFMCSIQKLAEATAETAFLGHAEYHSVAMSERLQSAANEMRQIKEETARKERDMIELQSVVIVESGRSLK